MEYLYGGQFTLSTQLRKANYLKIPLVYTGTRSNECVFYFPSQKSVSTHGFPGIPGSNGMPGMPGIPGPQGPSGRDGTKGQTGDKGSRGMLGQKGERGNEGPRGKSGPPGMMRMKGASGIVGDQGVKGDKGEKGESVTGPSSAVSQTNWKQCVWKNLNDDRDSGKIKVRIGSLHNPVTRYRINYAGTQITQLDFQSKGKSGWTGKSSFVLEIPLRYLRLRAY